jgi:tetratricopeptide (TPR) repeat protein
MTFSRSSLKILAVQLCILLGALALAGCGSREDRAQRYYDNATSYLAKQDYVKARVEIRNALQLKKDMVAAWRLLAQIDEHDRNNAGLTEDLRRIVELDEKDADARARLAKLFLLGGNFENALRLSNEATDLNPKNVENLAVKAAILFKLKDNDGAIRTAQQALELDPGNADASVVLAGIKVSQGDSESALKALNNVAPASKDDLGVIFLKIGIFERLGNLQQVESLLKRLTELQPNERAFRTQLIRFYVAQKRQDDAEREMRSIIEKNPTDTTAELDLASFLNATKGPAAAREELVSRINAGGKVFPYQLALARFDVSQGKVADSIKQLENLMSSTNAPDEVMAARTTLAEIYLGTNNVAAAEPLVTEILRQDGRNINGLRFRAAIHLTRGEIDDAIADLRSALNDQPQSPELLASLALAYERKGSIELADKAFFDATKASGYSPAFGLNYVVFLERRGSAAQAENVLTELATRNPNSIPVLSALARMKLARQDWAAAHTIADAIRRLGDKSYVSDQINALAFSGQKKFSDSLAALQNVYDANPNAVQPMAALVNVYIQSQQFDKAEVFLNAALKANPRNAEALVLLGSVALAKKEPEKAMARFEDAIKQQPDSIIGYKALAELNLRQQRLDEALKTVQAGLQQQPKNFDLRLTLGGLLETKGDYERAIAEFESLLKEQPNSLIVANNLASLLADHRTDKASLDRANALAVILTKSEVPQFKDTLGWIAYQRGDYTSAVTLLQDAAAKLPNHPLIRYHLGMSYLASGQDANASDQFNKARELAPNDASLKAKIDAALKSSSKKG